MWPIVNAPEDRATDVGNTHKNLVKIARSGDILADTQMVMKSVESVLCIY